MMPRASSPVPRLRAFLAALLSLVLSSPPAWAGVTVTQGGSATAWPGTPIVATVANPSAQLAVGESFGSGPNFTETFTVPAASNYQLQQMNLYVGGGTGTTASATITLNLFDLGSRTAPNPSSYTAGVNLFGGGSGLPIAYTSQSNGVLNLAFSGADQVILIAGHMYAFEIAGTSGTTPMNWIRTTADTYSGGAAYRNRAWINGTSARDFGLAVYGVVNNDPLPPTEATVNAGVLHQSIDGFGAGAVFLDAGLEPLSDATMDALYGTGPNQMALTLLRIRISPFGSGDWSGQISDSQKAAARGVAVLATPWTPPAAMKDNNNTVGGSLLPAQYQNYVDYLNQFTDTLAAAGGPVAVVSLQNEPDANVTYESAKWTADQFHTFCLNFAGNLKVPVMMPESESFTQSFSNQTLNDPASAANVDYIGGHLYGASVQDYPLAHSLGKHTWMTEFLINDQTIASAIDTAQQISDCLTVGNMSAYIWWKTIGNANGLLDASGALQRRAYVMSQWSRFVRPGNVRIDVSANTGPLGLSAFKDAASGRVVIVAVNNASGAQNQKFKLQGTTATSFTPWVTSATDSLAQKSAVAVTNGSFTYAVPGLSVTTFVGYEAPVITNAPTFTTAFGTPVSLPITATNAPTTYAASGLPPGLTIDPGTGLITGATTAAGEFDATIVAQNPGGIGSATIVFTVTGAPLSVGRGGFVLNRRTNQITQQVTVRNVAGSVVSGPIYLVLNSLSANTTLLNASGTTAGGAPYAIVTNGALTAGSSVSLTLTFSVPASGGITYDPSTPASVTH